MNTQPTQLLVIDPQVEDYQQLAAGIQPGVELLILDSNRDGIEQITEYLTGARAKQERIGRLENPQDVGALASPLQSYSHPSPKMGEQGGFILGEKNNNGMK